jgi:hypothetical protein
MTQFTSLAFQTSTEIQMDPAFATAYLICWGIFLIVILAAWWRVFSKADQPGWAAIIPIYNVIVLMQIAGKPWWWIILLLIPIVNFIIIILVYIDLAKAFGKGTGFALGLIFLNPIFMLLLAFGDAEYQGAPI